LEAVRRLLASSTTLVQTPPADRRRASWL